MRRQHRLTGRRCFSAVGEYRLASASGPLRVQAAPNPLAQARVGMAIRGVRGAVVRNLARRRLRAAIDPRLGACAGLDLVIVAAPGAAALPFGELCADLDRCLAGVSLQLARRTCA